MFIVYYYSTQYKKWLREYFNKKEDALYFKKHLKTQNKKLYLLEGGKYYSITE